MDFSNHEVTFGEDEIIVSKTDAKGKILYANEVFIRVSGFSEAELLGQPHNILRHPDMPRCVFKLMWDTIGSGEEIFAYVKNLTSDGAFYWVFAHVTPTFDDAGTIVGYHSNRRCPGRRQVAYFSDFYLQLLEEEKRYPDWRQGMAAGTALLLRTLAQKGLSYEEFIFAGLEPAHAARPLHCAGGSSLKGSASHGRQ